MGDLVGKQIPQMRESLELCQRAHAELCPSVPLAGWDVVLVDEKDDGGKLRIAPLLLEVNLSCNFFLGSFDEPWYFRFCEDWVRHVQDGDTSVVLDPFPMPPLLQKFARVVLDLASS